MSAELAPDFDPAQPRLSLQPIERPRRQLQRTPFLILLMTLLGLGMSGVLVLATSLQDETMELNQLQRQAAELRYEQAAMQAQLEDVSASHSLASRAWELGMRPNPNPAVIVMPEGRIEGNAKPAPANGLPQLAPQPRAVPSASASSAAPSASATATATVSGGAQR